MVLGVWFWVYGFRRIVWLWAYGSWAYDFGHMVLGIWFGSGHMVWLWAYGFGRIVLGVWFWAYGFGRMVWLWAYGCGRIVWMYDFGGIALQTRAGQAQKYIPILNRKMNN